MSPRRLALWVLVLNVLSLPLLPALADGDSAYQTVRPAIELPFQSTIVPLGSELWIDQHRFEVSLLRFAASVDEIAGYFESTATHRFPALGRRPLLVRPHEGGVLLSWWQASWLVSLQLRPAADEPGSTGTSGIMVVSRGFDIDEARLNSRRGPCSSLIKEFAEQVTVLRTVGNQDGERSGCVLIAQMARTPHDAAKLIGNQLIRKGYASAGLPAVAGSRQLLQHFEKDLIRISLGVHARAEDSLLVMQIISNPRVPMAAPHAQR